MAACSQLQKLIGKPWVLTSCSRLLWCPHRSPLAHLWDSADLCCAQSNLTQDTATCLSTFGFLRPPWSSLECRGICISPSGETFNQWRMEVTGKYSSLPASMRTAMGGILHPSESGLYTSDPCFLLIICHWFVLLSYLSPFSVFLAASQLNYLHPNCSTLGEHSYSIVWYNYLILVL